FRSSIVDQRDGRPQRIGGVLVDHFPPQYGHDFLLFLFLYDRVDEIRTLRLHSPGDRLGDYRLWLGLWLVLGFEEGDGIDIGIAHASFLEGGVVGCAVGRVCWCVVRGGVCVVLLAAPWSVSWWGGCSPSCSWSGMEDLNWYPRLQPALPFFV